MSALGQLPAFQPPIALFTALSQENQARLRRWIDKTGQRPDALIALTVEVKAQPFVRTNLLRELPRLKTPLDQPSQELIGGSYVR